MKINHLFSLHCTILYGVELYYRNSILKKLETGVFPTLNGTRFALVEFSGGTPWQEIRQALANVQMIGLTPVVAHIERYDVLEFKEERVRELINMGCYMQVNSNHVLKPKLFGDKEKIYKKRGRYFLEKDLIHFISSDMHNLDRRPPFMQEAYQVVEKEYGTTTKVLYRKETAAKKIPAKDISTFLSHILCNNCNTSISIVWSLVFIFSPK